MTDSPWKIAQLQARRIHLILLALNGRAVTLIVDETGDRKKGHKTDTVQRQYLGNLSKVEAGIVAVTIYGVIDGITFPLQVRVYKPKTRLKADDKYQGKPEIALSLIDELIALGFKFDLVLADSLYGESESLFSAATVYCVLSAQTLAKGLPYTPTHIGISRTHCHYEPTTGCDASAKVIRGKHIFLCLE